MIIDLDNPNQILSHVLFHMDHDSLAEVCGNDTITATVFMNGIEVPAETFEGALKQLFEQVEDYYTTLYKDEEKAVSDRVEKVLKERLSGLKDRLWELEEYLGPIIQQVL